jgi:hypothetical protein
MMMSRTLRLKDTLASNATDIKTIRSSSTHRNYLFVKNDNCYRIL